MALLAVPSSIGPCIDLISKKHKLTEVQVLGEEFMRKFAKSAGKIDKAADKSMSVSKAGSAL